MLQLSHKSTRYICVSLIMRRHLTVLAIGSCGIRWSRWDSRSTFIQLVANLYKEQESVVRTTNGDTDWFKIGRGVRQGFVISPWLYNIYSEHIMRCVLEEHHDGILQSEAEKRPICGLQTTQPCCAQVRKSCWAYSKRSKKPACPNTFWLTHKTQR